MLDFADAVAINKFERRGAEDARRDVARQLVRNREAFGSAPRSMPVFGTSAAASTTTASPRSTSTCATCSPSKGLPVAEGLLPHVDVRHSVGHPPGRPARPGALPGRDRRDRPRLPRADTEAYAAGGAAAASASTWSPASWPTPGDDADTCSRCWRRPARTLPHEVRRPARRLAGRRRVVLRRRAGRRPSATSELVTPLTRTTLSGNRFPRVALPRYTDDGELVRFLRAENLPGWFPFTAGVFPFKRDGEDPARMFAGEGDPFRTNRRFHLLAGRATGDPAVDRVRLGHPLRPRPRPAPRHLRQGRHVRASRSRRSTT